MVFREKIMIILKIFFSEEELVDLSFIIATANSRHRLAAAFLPEVGVEDNWLGFTK